ncbi:MAG TPA: YdcF family protein [Vicinamibacteria bacterium]|nr:YdcF family protein [Vicinamibacteria bacterium]
MARRGEGGVAARFGVGLAVGGVLGLIVFELELAGLLSFWGDASWLAVATALACGLLWLTPLRRVVAAAAVATALLWLAAAYTPMVARLRDGLERRDSPAAADAVFVFGSRIQHDGDPTSEAMSRLARGLQLVAEGHSCRLVVSEQRRSRSYAAIARAWAQDFAPKTEIVAVGPIVDTHDEALALARLFHSRGWRKVLAVTTPAHTRRAAACLEAVGLEVISVPSVETRYDYETLDEPRDRLRGLSAVLHERIGTFVYRRRGWIR